jgi:PAS domain S-box-containing protein
MKQQSIKVLLIEDNPGDARLLQELLKEVTSVQFYIEQADCLSQGLQSLIEQTFDVILLDLSLPDSQDLETFVKLHRQAMAVPIVVVTGLDDETLAVRAVQMGAQDYLVKGKVSSDLLARSIRYAIERKRTEQQIREQAALLNIATDAILVRDLQSKILFWNQGAERLYGWKAEEALGQDASKLLYKSDSSQFQKAYRCLIAEGEWYGEIDQITKAGKAVLVASRWTLMRDEDAKPKSILVVSTDITEKKQLEAQFLRIQRMESIGTLASGIAHDLNNILTPILATAQLLKIRLVQEDERTQRMLEIVEVNTKRGAALIKQVLSFARGVEGKQTILQIKHLIREIQQIAEETFPKSIEVYNYTSPNLWTITGNVTQLHQVLMNLCVNARDAMPNGGKLSISAENFVVDENYARMNLDAKVGSYIVVTLTDTGTGIPAEMVDRIFEPFFTTKEVGKGTGLGLSTVIGIVKSHGGFINVTSVMGEGTEFKVFLPAAKNSEIFEEQGIEIPTGQGELVLIVDDEAAICEASRTLLETYSYRVLTATNGIEAIGLYVQHQHDISVVIVDLMMPMMDGTTMIRTLQEINSKVKIIAVSGLAPSKQILAETPTQIFLSKPYSPQDFLRAVYEILQVKSSTVWPPSSASEA